MLRIIRSALCPKVILDEDIQNYGWEKAYILANLDRCTDENGELCNKQYLHKFFPVIEHDYFYFLLDELLDAGLVVEGEKHE